jgi:hypothetical protein
LCGHYAYNIRDKSNTHSHHQTTTNQSSSCDEHTKSPSSDQHNHLNDNQDHNENVNADIDDEETTFLTTFFEHDIQHAIEFSIEQKVHIKLLDILEKIQAPDYVFQKIIQWAIEAKCLNYSFMPQLTTRSAVIEDLCQHVQMKSAKPIVSDLQLPHINKPASIVSFDFKHQLCSLLNDPMLMKPENLCINPASTFPNGEQDASPWFMPYIPNNNMLTEEVLSGSWYQATCKKYNKPDDFICPLILYVDKTFIDPMHSNFNLEPLNFTLAIFKQKCRTQIQFWRTLGYIPVLPVIEDKQQKNSLTKAQIYHIYVKHLLKDIIDLQSNVVKCQNFPLRIGSCYKCVTLCMPIAFIIADTQGADKLCGRYLTYSTAVARVHRACKCPSQQAADTTQKCVWVTMEEMMDIIQSQDKNLMAEYSQQYLPNHAFDGIDFGANPYGVYGATPYDILHGMKLGIVQHTLNMLHDQDMNPTSRHAVDLATTKLMPYFRQGGTSSYPRLYFPNGLSTLTNASGEESVGILFMTYIHLSTKFGHQAYSNHNHKFTMMKGIKYIKIFEFLLVFIEWLSSSREYWNVNDKQAMKKALSNIYGFVRYLTSNFERDSKQKWNISKIHELFHVPQLITSYGSPINFDSSANERMHKVIAKQPGRRSQKRIDSFDYQCALRLAQHYVINKAFEIVSKSHEKHIQAETLNTEKQRKACPSTFMTTYHNQSKANKKSGGGTITASVYGTKSLNLKNLNDCVYPNLVEFIAYHFAKFNNDGTVICLTEAIGEDHVVYRCHPNYQKGGFWHDWAWVKFEDNKNSGYVPAKLLAFIPEGIPGSTECHAVCHPCQWKSKKVSSLLECWILEPCDKQINNGIPYEMVPLTSLSGHCLAIPDLSEPGHIYTVLPRKEWANLFWETNRLFK